MPLKKRKVENPSVHLIGLLSDRRKFTPRLKISFLCLEWQKKRLERKCVYSLLLDGRDVPQRTADVYVEMLEIKLADIGVREDFHPLRTLLCDGQGRKLGTHRPCFYDARSFRRRTCDRMQSTAIRDSFLRGIADEFIQPIVLEDEAGKAIAAIKDGDLVIYFNHRPDRMQQLVKFLSVAEKLPPRT